MKLLASLILLGSLFTAVNASEMKKTTKKQDSKVETSMNTKKEADCDKPKEDFLKKIEAEKKAKAEAGKGLSLQGAKDTGCSL